MTFIRKMAPRSTTRCDKQYTDSRPATQSPPALQAAHGRATADLLTFFPTYSRSSFDLVTTIPLTLTSTRRQHDCQPSIDDVVISIVLGVSSNSTNS